MNHNTDCEREFFRRVVVDALRLSARGAGAHYELGRALSGITDACTAHAAVAVAAAALRRCCGSPRAPRKRPPAAVRAVYAACLGAVAGDAKLSRVVTALGCVGRDVDPVAVVCDAWRNAGLPTARFQTAAARVRADYARTSGGCRIHAPTPSTVYLADVILAFGNTVAAALGLGVNHPGERLPPGCYVDE